MKRRSILAGSLATLLLAMLGAPALAQTSRPDKERQQQTQVLDSFGGAFAGPQQAYVARIGDKMAVAAGMGGRCTFTLVNSEIINAFAAPPGCYVYVTRGLLGILNSEAELAGVLGHEVGHVTAKHATRQRNTQVLGGLAAVLVGAVTKSDQLGQLAGQAAQLGVLSYSRGQEYEADTLAVKYLPIAGYPSTGISRALAALQRQDEYATRAAGAVGGKAIPVWARTHPLTGARIARAGRAAAAGAVPIGVQPANEAAFLAAVDGLVYGDDPAQGFVRGSAFAHPGLRIAFDAPRGFTLSNGPSAVGISGPNGLRGQFSGGRLNGPIEDYAAAVLRATLGQAAANVGQTRRTTIGGLEAAMVSARATSNNQSVDVSVVAYNLGGGAAYQFVTLSPSGQAAVFDTMYASFRRLSDGEAARYLPRRIEVITVRSGDTSESLSARMAGDSGKLELFQMLNDVRPGEALTSGRKVKLVMEPRR